jgi:hypothetical protein
MIAAAKPKVQSLLVVVIDGCHYRIAVRSLGVSYDVQKVGSQESRRVTDTFDGTRCTCPGFAHRKKCRHVAALREVGLLSG